MLEKHKENDASLTVAVLEVPMKDASRFGIMNTDKNDRIIEFDEKPAEPKSNLASMGIYIFDWSRLRSMLLSNYTKDGEMVDFGKHVIPSYLESGDNVFAYRFSGYWKDVGTIDSLWEANMEFIDPAMELNIRDKSWQVFSKNPIAPPHFVTETGAARNSCDGWLLCCWGNRAQYFIRKCASERRIDDQGQRDHAWSGDW